MEEIWKPIPGYEGFYEVSSYGQVRTVYRIMRNRSVPAKIRKPNIMRGYQCIALKRDGTTKVFRIHRLVAEAFIGKAPSDDHQINHIDGNKENNRVENLEWVLPVENTRHAIKTGLRKPKDDEARRKIGERTKGYWQRPEYRQKQRQKALQAWADPVRHRERALAIKQGIQRAKEARKNG